MHALLVVLTSLGLFAVGLCFIILLKRSIDNLKTKKDRIIEKLRRIENCYC